MPTQQLLLTPYNIQHGSLASYDNSRDDSFTVADAASATNTAATFAVSSGNHASATASAIKSSLFLTSLPTYQSLMAGGGGVAGYQEAGDGAAATAPDLLASPLPSFACVTEDGTYQGISSTTAGFTTMTSSAPDSAAPSSSANSSMLSHLLDHSPHVTQHYAAAAAQRSAASGPYPVIVGTMRGGSAEGISSPASSPYALGLPSGFNDIGYDEVRERLCVEVRLPPLKPKVAVQPRLLVSGCKSLFLAPASAGGTMLQWTTASSGELQIPLGLSRAVFEDFDSAPSGVVVMPTTELTYLTTASGASGPGATAAAVPEQVSADAVTCTLMDEVAGTLWTGHSSGRMCRWLVEKGVGAVWKQQWVGSRTGSILALTSTAWGDLWTASMAGSIRVWNYPDGIAGNRPPTQILEVKRPLGGKPHGRKVVGMAASSSGGTVWTAGRSSILIWNAYSMQCLGALRSPFTGTGEGSIAPSIMDGDVPWISTITGVDASLLKRPVEGRRLQPGSADPEFDTDPRAVIGIQVLKGVKGVGKFAAKLGKKIQNIAASVSCILLA
ncbi:hypothetical protein CEUSTIGMA_g13875.t1 [Chlamydomonas eustigma]|uniref:IP5PC-F beta-propeller domain-containing protein n=1 Tax=Chlamydomonas eustigma TaxID=1157962 RepID=A0A250XTR2_9CHLO|nr:hypothetical protein CEUSTIGMA_g13875.t1 [Chlamydomonas eustigma]|eukprot:GAX86465.1 hypothetical protein CEUSTIGMA_g13875.t1 [Chlamydomonas eustigma]